MPTKQKTIDKDNSSCNGTRSSSHHGTWYNSIEADLSPETKCDLPKYDISPKIIYPYTEYHRITSIQPNINSFRMLPVKRSAFLCVSKIYYFF